MLLCVCKEGKKSLQSSVNLLIIQVLMDKHIYALEYLLALQSESIYITLHRLFFFLPQPEFK